MKKEMLSLVNIINEMRFTCGVEDEHRDNEVIIVLNSTNEEGYELYLDFPGDGDSSTSNSFGHGELAEHMSNLLFTAMCNEMDQAISQSDNLEDALSLFNEHYSDTFIAFRDNKLNPIEFKQMISFLERNL